MNELHFYCVRECGTTSCEDSQALSDLEAQTSSLEVSEGVSVTVASAPSTTLMQREGQTKM